MAVKFVTIVLCTFCLSNAHDWIMSEDFIKIKF